MLPAILGLDIGGANLKAALPSGAARSLSFPLWKRPGDLAEALKGLVRSFPPPGELAVTMTGELCDCYTTKREGVIAVLDALGAAVQSSVVVWCTDGRFRSAAEVRQAPLMAAAANWLALATFAGRFVPSGPALLVDVGSTTTDLVPLLDGRPVPLGRDDPTRLISRELVYTGVGRTPLCSLLRGPVATELFATTRDAYLVLGDQSEDPEELDTADGRPATQENAHDRLARMLGGDRETTSGEERLELARQAGAYQLCMLVGALEKVARRLPGPPREVVISGSGEFLAARVLAASRPSGCSVVSLRKELGVEVSDAACAYSVAVLYSET